MTGDPMAGDAKGELPLADVRVLDLSRLVAGNMLTMVLGDFGADVIKVEQPGAGDPLRAWKSDGLELWWRVYGRNKRSITLNLAQAKGRELLLRLLPSTDLLVESFLPGTLEYWDLAPGGLLERNPGLVIVRISGWGQDGPYRRRPGFGTFVEAMSGFAAMTGPADAPPTLPPVPLGDMSAALYGATAAMIALHQRDREGRGRVGGGARSSGGQVIDLSLLEPLFSLLGPLAAEYRLTGRIRHRIGNRTYNSAPRNTYRTRDGEWIAISASTPTMAAQFFRALGRADLLDDERFATNDSRLRHVDELDQVVGEEIGRSDLADLLARFEEQGVGAAPVYDIAQLLADPHVQARGMVVDVSDRADPTARPTPMHAVIPRFGRTPGEIRWPGPALGSYNEEIYGGELALPAAERERLHADGVI